MISNTRPTPRLAGPALAIAALTSTGLGVVPAQGRAPIPDLLHMIAGARDPLADGSTVRRSRAVRVDLDLLARLDPDDGAVVRVALFDDRVYRARFERREDHAPGEYDWHGTLEGHAGSSFILSVVRDGVAATLLPNDDHPYELSIQGAPGMHFARELDATRHGCGCDRCGAPPAPERGQRPGGGDPARACSDDPYYADVLAVYDNHARTGSGGDARVQAQFRNRIAWANQSLQNSGVPLRFRLVAVRHVDYYGVRDMVTDLKRLTNRDGYMDEVHGWRLQYDADLVTLFVGDWLRPTLGVAWRPSVPAHFHPGSGFSA